MTAARRSARAAALPLLLALASSCGSDAVLEDPVDPTPLPSVSVAPTPGGIVQLDLPKFRGISDVVEPDVVHVPSGWRGFNYWMAYNPYPGGDDEYENASIVAGQDGFAWSVPDGLTNPVAPWPSGAIVHNSDPDLVYVPQLDRMVLFYRAVTVSRNVLFAKSSTDGRNWGKAQMVLDAPSHSLVSPSIVLPTSRRPKLFYVDAGQDGCFAHVTATMMRRWMGDLHRDDALVGPGWSDTVRTDLNGPPGYLIWHLDVIWVDERQEYWAIFPAFAAGADCNSADLFMARSRDAVHWQVLADPVLRRGDVTWGGSTLYRASLEYDANASMFRVWLSARSIVGDWRIGHETFPVANVLAALRRADQP
ncbi:MAG: hypothetical protein ACHQU8_06320 [Gemmatimonadales bacterium]